MFLENLCSPHIVWIATTSFEKITRINFLLTNAVYFQRLERSRESSQSNKVAANLLSQLVEQESVGFSDFNSAPFQLFET